MDGDDVLPFRVLSPGNNPRLLNKNKFSKLSLKCRSKASEEKKASNKENKCPSNVSSTRSAQAQIADILTSDESELGGSFATVGGYQCQESSAGSTQFQESTAFLNPIAESTRYEFERPACRSQQTSERYYCPQYTTDNGSASHDFTTADCSSEDCDESVIVISDSDNKSSKRIAVNKRARTIVSKSLIIISSDESDCDSKPLPRYIPETTNSHKLTVSEKNVCTTVLVGSSESENDYQGGTDMSSVPVVVAPSVRSSSSSIGSIISNSLISEDGSCKLKNKKKLMMNSSPSSIGSLVSNSVVSDSEVPLKSCKPCESTAEHVDNPVEIKNAPDEACKENFQLVLQDSAANESYQKKTTPEWFSRKSLRTPVTLTKDKYQDIRRWLLKSRSSDSDEINEGEAGKPHQSDNDQDSPPGSISFPQRDNSVAGCSITETKMCRPVKCPHHSTSSSGTPKEQKEIKLPRAITPTSDESDDRFESFVNSVKQKKINTLPKQPEPDSSFINNNSSEEDRFSPCLYLTARTGTKDIGSKKTNKKEDDCRKKLWFTPESSDSAPAESGDESSDWNPKQFKLQRRRRRGRVISDSDSSSSDSEKNPRNLKGRRKAVPKRVESSDSDETKWKPNITSTAPPRMATKLPFKIPVPVTSFTPQAKLKGKAALVPYSPIRTFLTSLSGPPIDPSIRSHPAAEVYFKNFKKKKEELTQRLFKLYNREVFDSRLPQDLTLEWNARMLRTAGFCYCRITKKAGTTTRSARIVLSAKVVDSAQRLRDTLIHEMCHAAVWLLNNISGGHGPFWKAWADKAMKRFPELPAITRCHDYKIETKFTYRCTDCGYSFGRHSKSLDLERKRCGICYGKFEVLLTKCLSQDSKENAPPKTPRPPTAFALFVKENYATVKKENIHFKHGDVMKKLGEHFSKMKLKSAS